MWPLSAYNVSKVLALRRLLHTKSFLCEGFDLMSLENKGSPAKEEFYFDFLYGIHPISCALEAKRRSIKTIFYRKDLLDHNERIREILKRCWAENIQTQPVNQSRIENMIGKGKPHQGLLAKTTRLYYTPTQCTHQFISDLEKEGLSKQVWLMLYEIQDPMNFGSILRSAYFLGCSKVFVTSQRSCPLTPVASKASSGVMELFPVHSVSSATRFCEILKESNWAIAGTGSPKSMNIGHASVTPCVPVDAFRHDYSTLIILGNEGKGLTEELKSLCTHKLYIKSRGDLNESVDSLNVSAAAAVILHSVVKNYEHK